MSNVRALETATSLKKYTPSSVIFQYFQPKLDFKDIISGKLSVAFSGPAKGTHFPELFSFNLYRQVKGTKLLQT